MHEYTVLLLRSFKYSVFFFSLLLWLLESREESPGSLLKELLCTKRDSTDN